jgi:phosphoserine phosphatase
MDVHGAAITNISDMLKTLDLSVPTFLSYSKCRDESALLADIKGATEAGVNYPFEPPAALLMSGKDEVVVKHKETGAPVAVKSGDHTPVVKPVKHKVKCSRCGGSDTEIVPKLCPPICYNCVKIDMFLASKLARQGQDRPES